MTTPDRDDSECFTQTSTQLLRHLAVSSTLLHGLICALDSGELTEPDMRSSLTMLYDQTRVTVATAERAVALAGEQPAGA